MRERSSAVAGQRFTGSRFSRRTLELSLVFLMSSFPCFSQGHFRSRLPRVTEVRPELVLQNGHTLPVQSVAFSRDGRLLASGGADHVAKIWDVVTGRELRTLKGHSDLVVSVAFHPNDRQLATAGFDGRVKLWDIASGEVQKCEPQREGIINSIAFSPNGKWLALADNDKSLVIWDMQKCRQHIALNEHSAAVETVAFSNDGHWLASGSKDKTVVIWDANTWKKKVSLQKHTDTVKSVAFSYDSTLLASGSEDQTLRVWQVPTGAELHVLNSSKEVVAVVFGKGDKWIASTGDDRAVTIWDCSNWYDKKTLTTNEGPSIDLGSGNAIAFSAAADRLAVGDENGKIKFWNTLSWQPGRTLRRYTGPVLSVAFSPDGRWLATAGYDWRIRLWDVASGGEMRHWRGHANAIRAIAFSPNGKFLASASADKTAKIWKVTTGQVLHNLDKHTDIVSTVAFNNDGTLLVTGSNDKTVKVWDVETGTQLTSLVVSGRVYCVAFDPKGKWLAAGEDHDDMIRLWETNTWKELPALSGHEGTVNTIAVSQESDHLASGSGDGVLKIWNTNDWTNPLTWTADPESVTTLAFTPDGEQLASGGSDSTIKLWDARTGKKIYESLGHNDAIKSVSFDRYGTWLASASLDSTTRIWDRAQGKQRAIIISPTQSADWLVINPDGLFDGLPGAWDRILWRFSNETTNVSPVELFTNEFYYSNLLSGVITGKPIAAPAHFARLDRHQPKLMLKLAAGQAVPPTGIATRKIRIRIEIAPGLPQRHSHKHRNRAGQAALARGDCDGARDVRLMRNGTLVKVWHDNVSPDKRGNCVLQADVPIVEGDNQLVAYAFNQDDIKTQDVSLVVKGSASLKSEGRVYVLAVGVNRYTNSEFELNYAEADAAAFIEGMKTAQQRLGHPPPTVINISGKFATQKNIQIALQRLAGMEIKSADVQVEEQLSHIQPAQPDDLIALFFAGHGLSYQGHFFFVPYDMGYGGPRLNIDEVGLKTIRSHSISDAALATSFEAIDTGQMLLIIDACDSGSVLGPDSDQNGPLNSRGLSQLAYEKGMYILTAAQKYEVANELGLFGHGLLSQVLMEDALLGKNADTEPVDGHISVREWLTYTARRLPEIQREKMGLNPDRVQSPRLFYRRDTIVH